jgi:hypothetical protein
MRCACRLVVISCRLAKEVQRVFKPTLPRADVTVVCALSA